ncbi:rubrerythrin family protein [Flavobacteriaceae bacterium JJC]|nr:rubrerythrin family protein [Flavobacteriaceae bacterium JJC]
MNLKNIQTEVDASFLYGILAEKEENKNVKEVFRQMSEIEKSHALAFLKKTGLTENQMPKPSGRAKTLKVIGSLIGYDYVLGVLMDTEKSLANSVGKARIKTGTPASVSDTSHVKILETVLENNPEVAGNALSRFEKRHRSVGGNALRAAVLGGNDGLVSNFSLVMGIAGATSGQSEVLLTGLAGLLAGALSMSLGEWISVQSSKELYENQMSLEMDELEVNPEGELKEIALIYRAKGIPQQQAEKMADQMMSDKFSAHQFLVQEELGINVEELKGSAMEAALASFFLFAVGAIIPVIPFFFWSGTKAIVLSAGFSAVGLFLIGSAITLFTAKSVWFSGMRQVIFGLLAAAITFAIGRLIGVSVMG